ncbi:MAG: hypothetical protein AM326_00590 [Candidatus Thorarchaeota archaeon SMTZ-45]|nr:MAG: hypothetical protein AM326_00590 [Candidatus Thorarchaeota archaeon SMTZ-45]
MVTSRKVLRGAVGHIILFIINFLVFVGLVESYQILTTELPLLTGLVLGYMVIHTTILLSVQLGIQVLELIRIRMPTLLISYYFLFDDDEAIPMPLLDPVKSRLGVITLLLVISGGPVFFPIFAASGLLFVMALLVQNPLTLPLIISYFIEFINWMPPLLVLIVAIVIASIVIIEFRHV